MTLHLGGSIYPIDMDLSHADGAHDLAGPMIYRWSREVPVCICGDLLEDAQHEQRLPNVNQESPDRTTIECEFCGTRYAVQEETPWR